MVSNVYFFVFEKQLPSKEVTSKWLYLCWDILPLEIETKEPSTICLVFANIRYHTYFFVKCWQKKKYDERQNEMKKSLILQASDTNNIRQFKYTTKQNRMKRIAYSVPLSYGHIDRISSALLLLSFSVNKISFLFFKVYRKWRK